MYLVRFELPFLFCMCVGGGRSGGCEFLAEGGGLEFDFFFGDARRWERVLVGGLGEGRGTKEGGSGEGSGRGKGERTLPLRVYLAGRIP